MTALRDLTGQRFGRLMVLSRGENRKGRKIYWHVQCDCGMKKEVAAQGLFAGETRSCGCSLRRDRIRHVLIGQRFGRLMVIGLAINRIDKTFWHVQCDCGIEKEVLGQSLLNGATHSCGCLFRERIHVQIGQRFGRLMVIDRALNKNGRTFWHVQCYCGNKSIIAGSHMVSGNTRSCGCLAREATALRSISHGLTRSLEYGGWASMRSRCQNLNNTSYFNYGARGIMVCERWNDFANFYADMGPRPSPKHSLNRIDNNGNYEPGNCHWATPLEQNNNQRGSTAHYNKPEIIRGLQSIGMSEVRIAAVLGVSGRYIREALVKLSR